MNKWGVLKAVCDVDFEKAVAMGQPYDATPYLSLDELLAREKSVSVVCICTPNGLHAAHTVSALNAGFHVLCEKPMATSVQDAKLMLDAAKTMKKQLFIVKQNRFNAPVAALKDALDKGRLGKIYSVQINCFWNRNAEYYKNPWKGTHDLDGGTLFTQFSHFIDLMYWMVGDVKKVFALTQNLGHLGMIDFEDTGVVAVEFINGALGTVHYTVNSFGKNMEGSLTIFGEKGTVKIGGEYLDRLEYQNVEGPRIEADGELSKDLSKSKVVENSNLDKVYRNVMEVLNGNTATTNAEESLKTVEIITKIYQSSKNI
jgi:predicted dehydrogenase